MIYDNTPVETYSLNGVEILVKREDLCSPLPGPQLAKVRGLYAHLAKRPEKFIGALDGYHSRNGWATAWVCKILGKTALTFYPQRKADPPDIRSNQAAALALGSQVVPLQAGRQTVLQHQAARALRINYGDENSYMLPNALKLREAVEQCEIEAERTFKNLPGLPSTGTLILPIGTGTMAAGVTRGTPIGWRIIFVAGYSRNFENTRRYMAEIAGFRVDSSQGYFFVDSGYSYSEAETRNVGVPPFPCNPYYERKAWYWLWSHPSIVQQLPKPILFWNFGA